MTPPDDWPDPPPSTVETIETLLDKPGPIDITNIVSGGDDVPELTDEVKRYLIIKIRLPSEFKQRTHIAARVMLLMEKLGCVFSMRAVKED